MNPSRLASRLPLGFVPWAVLAVGLAATVILVTSAHREMKARDAERFSHETRQLVALMESRLRTYGQALMGLRDWFKEHQKEMTEVLWKDYMHTFHAPAHYPGLFDVGFAEFVMSTDAPHAYTARDRHIERTRKRLGAAYGIRLPPGITNSQSWYQIPVVWQSYCQWRRETPRPYQHYGMDLNQDSDLWSAMNWALGQDVPGMSGKHRIDPDNPDSTGLMLFLPVYFYQPDLSADFVLMGPELTFAPKHQEEVRMWKRHAHALHGLVFGSIDVPAFLKHHLDTNAPTVTFALYASTNHLPGNPPENLLFDNRVRRSTNTSALRASALRTTHSALDSSAPAHLRVVKDVPLYGRVLRFIAEPGPAFSSTLSRRTLALAGTFGVATTILLAGFIAYLARANRKEHAIASALRRSEVRLQMLLHDREQISRNLHDGTIQSLYAIGLGLGRLRRALSGVAERERLDASLRELDHVVGELRGYLTALDPGVSPAQSAATALSELVARLRQTTETQLSFTADAGAGDGWPPAAVLDVLQTAREGVSNALRHGKATEVELALQRGSGCEVLFSIVDNGKGFDPSAARPKDSHGLVNLERRAQAWNGWLRIDSAPGGPTKLTLALSPLTKPLPASSPAARDDDES